MGSTEQENTGGRRLDSWKEIGAFFNRDERTVKRWEVTRGLPVRRVPGGGRVYAYAEELTAWLKGTEGQNEPELPAVPMLEAVPPSVVTAAPELPVVQGAPKRARFSPAFVVVAAVLLIGGALLVARPWWTTRLRPRPQAAHQLNPKAQDLYLKGIYYWHKRTPESLNQAVDAFTQAIVIDPDYAAAYVGLANCYNLLREYASMPDAEAYPRAIAAAQRAIALDDSLAGGHSALAFAEFYWSWKLADSEKEFKRAIELSPNSPPAHHWYATSLMELGRGPEALSEINRAQALDPQSPAVLADKGLILYVAGEKESARKLLEEVEASEPSFLSPHDYLAGIALQDGDHRGYLKESRKAAELRKSADQLDVIARAERGYADGGRRGMLTAKLQAEGQLYAAGKISAFTLASNYALLGDKDRAMELLDEAYRRHETLLLGVEIAPEFNSLHGDARFRQLVEKIGLPAPR